MFTRIINQLSLIWGYFKHSDSVAIADKEKQAHRLNICAACPNRNENFEINGKVISNNPQCDLCKCVISSKVIWDEEKCPLGQW